MVSGFSILSKWVIAWIWSILHISTHSGFFVVLMLSVKCLNNETLSPKSLIYHQSVVTGPHADIWMFMGYIMFLGVLSVCKCFLERAKEKHWGSCLYWCFTGKRIQAFSGEEEDSGRKCLCYFDMIIWDYDYDDDIVIYVSLCHQTTFLLLKMSTKAVVHLRMRNYVLWDYISDICVWSDVILVLRRFFLFLNL